VIEGALAVHAMVAACPEGTIHVAVVDPGVGTRRRGLVIAAVGQLFVGPDNGIFTPVLSDPECQAFELQAAEYRRSRVSATFHGRDVFAPAAAHLGRGIAPERFGPPVTDLVRVALAATREVGGRVQGQVIHVDRFGNLVTSIDSETVERLSHGADVLTVRIAGRRMPVVRTYGDLPIGGAGALAGSHGRLEVAVRGGSAGAIPRAARDDGPPQPVDDFADEGEDGPVDAEPPAGAGAFSVFSAAGFSTEVLSLAAPLLLLLFSDSSAFFRDSEG
jgi:S-adenosyl-L-methionine hydrolase (adenosine-forming)